MSTRDDQYNAGYTAGYDRARNDQAKIDAEKERALTTAAPTLTLVEATAIRRNLIKHLTTVVGNADPEALPSELAEEAADSLIDFAWVTSAPTESA